MNSLENFKRYINYELLLSENDINKNTDLLENWYRSIFTGGGQLNE